MNRMQRWREKMRKLGLIEVRVTVPFYERDTILAVAHSLRPLPVEIDGETVEPSLNDRRPSSRFIAYAEKIADKIGTDIPPPIRRSNNRLCGWVWRNKSEWGEVDQIAEARRLEKISQLKKRLEDLS